MPFSNINSQVSHDSDELSGAQPKQTIQKKRVARRQNEIRDDIKKIEQKLISINHMITTIKTSISDSHTSNSEESDALTKELKELEDAKKKYESALRLLKYKLRELFLNQIRQQRFRQRAQKKIENIHEASAIQIPDFIITETNSLLENQSKVDMVENMEKIHEASDNMTNKSNNEIIDNDFTLEAYLIDENMKLKETIDELTKQLTEQNLITEQTYLQIKYLVEERKRLYEIINNLNEKYRNALLSTYPQSSHSIISLPANNAAASIVTSTFQHTNMNNASAFSMRNASHLQQFSLFGMNATPSQPNHGNNSEHRAPTSKSRSPSPSR